MYYAKILISPKKSVLDPQGKAVHHALDSLGFDKINNIRVGKFIEVAVDEPDATAARKSVADMCEKLLANTIVENYSFELTKQQ